MRVGISGHQKLQPSGSVEWVEGMLREELGQMHADIGISSLAAGTDQLFAAIVLELGLELEAVIPCKAYETTFKDSIDRDRYEDLKQRATRSYCLDYPQPSEQAFLRAGERIVETCDAMLFVWNGKPSAGRGGTADIVAYTKSKAIPYVHLNPSVRSVSRCNANE